jgi:hypothetical protein
LRDSSSFHRCGSFFREHRGDQVGVLVLVLVAEITAHVFADDANLLLRDSEIAGHIGPAIRDATGRRVDGQFVAVPTRDGGTALHLGVVDERGRESVFEHLIGGREAGSDVAATLGLGQQLVAVVWRDVAVGPHLRRVGLEGFFEIEHKRQRFVLDGNQLKRIFGGVAIHRGDRRNRFAGKPHRVVERVALVGGDPFRLLVVLLASGNRSRAPLHRCNSRE